MSRSDRKNCQQFAQAVAVNELYSFHEHVFTADVKLTDIFKILFWKTRINLIQQKTKTNTSTSMYCPMLIITKLYNEYY